MFHASSLYILVIFADYNEQSLMFFYWNPYGYTQILKFPGGCQQSYDKWMDYLYMCIHEEDKPAIACSTLGLPALKEENLLRMSGMRFILMLTQIIDM